MLSLSLGLQIKTLATLIFTKEKNFEFQIKEGGRGSDLSRLSVGSVSVVACMRISVFCGEVWVLVAVGRLQTTACALAGNRNWLF